MNNTFYFVRHGNTTFNEKKICQGWLDVPLNKKGMDEAVVLYNSIKGFDFDLAYCSPLLRAYQTAKIGLGLAYPVFINEMYCLRSVDPNKINLKIPLIVEPRLVERGFGELEGESLDDYAVKFSKYKGRDVTFSFHDCADGGESLLDLEERTANFINDISRQYDRKRILVFTHNGNIIVARKHFLNLSEEEALSHKRNPHCELIEFHK